MSMLIRNRMRNRLLALFSLALLQVGCASAPLPEEHHDHYAFPPYRVYLEEPTGKAIGVPYKILGWVRSKAEFATMEQEVNNSKLCKNYYNKAARLLLKEADKVHADAVIKVRSVVFNLDGTVEEHATPECSDDGAEGEVLLRGIAIKFTPNPKKPQNNEARKSAPKPSSL